MGQLVILIESLTDVEEDEQDGYDDVGRWHLSVTDDDPRILCTGLAYQDGESVWKGKTVKRGGITCEHCINKIKWFKSIKL